MASPDKARKCASMCQARRPHSLMLCSSLASRLTREREVTDGWTNPYTIQKFTVFLKDQKFVLMEGIHFSTNKKCMRPLTSQWS